MNQDNFQPWPIFWKRFRNARLVSSSLALMDARKRVLLESVSGPHCARENAANRYFFLPKPVALEGPWTSVVDEWSVGSGYFHWLMESCPRLALLGEFPPQTRIVVPSGLKNFQIETLKCMGLLERCRPAGERHLIVEDYYFSSPTALTGCDNPYAVRFLRDQFLKHADPAGPVCEKLYIRRRGKTRGIVNEQEVRRFFEDHGWTILDMEDLSFARQIRLFSQVRVVCGLHGAAFTNLVWCRPGASALELCSSNFLNGCYEGIASYVGVNHRYIIFPGDHRFAITVDMKTLESMLAEMGAL